MRLNKQTGIKRRAFTLIEILVVLVIMGLLAAMVAPKLAGIVDFSEDPIDDVNLKELAKIVADFSTQHERIPKNLVNLVEEDNTSNTYRMLSIHSAAGETADLSAQFEARLVPTLHVLNAYEVKELRRLGVRSVRNYRHTFSGSTVEYNQEVPLSAGTAVLMVGCGAEDNTSNVDWSDSFEGSINDNGSGTINYYSVSNEPLDVATSHVYACMDGAPYVGRIIMGIDNESELVQKKYLDTAGTSPKEARKEEIKWLHYAILLPRLDATVKRMDGVDTLVLRKYDEEIEEGCGSKTIEMNKETQNISDIAVVSPQGLIAKEKNFKYGVKVQ
jgi:prepilin-type N-terminal cleavage/methylation domain-containing protein